MANIEVASGQQLEEQQKGLNKLGDVQTSQTWVLLGRVWEVLKHSWACFDKHAGYWLGLDVPKYAWAIHEHNRLLKEEEESVLGTQEFKKNEQEMDELEGQIGGPQLGSMTRHSAPRAHAMAPRLAQYAELQGIKLAAPAPEPQDPGGNVQEKYEFFKP